MIPRGRKINVLIDLGNGGGNTNRQGNLESRYTGKPDEHVELTNSQGTVIIPASRIVLVEQCS